MLLTLFALFRGAFIGVALVKLTELVREGLLNPKGNLLALGITHTTAFKIMMGDKTATNHERKDDLAPKPLTAATFVRSPTHRTALVHVVVLFIGLLVSAGGGGQQLYGYGQMASTSKAWLVCSFECWQRC